MQNWVVVSNIFHVHPYLGKWSNLTNIFQMGWNHQLENVIIIEVSDIPVFFRFGDSTFQSFAGHGARLKHPPDLRDDHFMDIRTAVTQTWGKSTSKWSWMRLTYADWHDRMDWNCFCWCLMKQVWTLYLMICIHHPLKTTTVCRRKKSFPDDVPFCFFQMQIRLHVAFLETSESSPTIGLIIHFLHESDM